MEAKAWQKRGNLLALLCWITILGGLVIMMGRHSRLPAPPISVLQAAYSATPFHRHASSADKVKALSICDRMAFAWWSH
jgi:hypothetical protein